jgi:hypothetical protein
MPIGKPIGMGAPNVGMGAPIGMPNVGCCCTQIELGFARWLRQWLAVFARVQEMRDAGDDDRKLWQHHCHLGMAASKAICLLCMCFPSRIRTHMHSRNIANNKSKATSSDPHKHARDRNLWLGARAQEPPQSFERASRRPILFSLASPPGLVPSCH